MKKKIILVIGIGLLIGAFVSFIYFYSVYRRVVVKPISSKTVIGFTHEKPTPTSDPLAPYNILILGYGGGSHDGGFLTDTIIVSHVDPKKNEIVFISIPRDVWLSLPLTSSEPIQSKINAAYAFGLDNIRYPDKPIEFTGKAGGGQLAKYAASQVVGMPIDLFIAVSFNGFEKGIDTLGGVDVNVPHTFNDKWYPIEQEKNNTCGKSEKEIQELSATISGDLLEKEFPCRYEQLYFKEGIEHMSGERALKFVRSRKSELYGGDYNRSIRQFALIKAVKDKVISIGFISKLIPFISSVTYDMQTDIDASVIKDKLSTNPDPSAFTVRSIGLTSDNVFKESRSDDGQYILIPLAGEGSWKNVHEYIQKEIN